MPAVRDNSIKTTISAEGVVELQDEIAFLRHMIELIAQHQDIFWMSVLLEVHRRPAGSGSLWRERYLTALLAAVNQEIEGKRPHDVLSGLPLTWGV